MITVSTWHRFSGNWLPSSRKSDSGVYQDIGRCVALVFSFRCGRIAGANVDRHGSEAFAVPLGRAGDADEWSPEVSFDIVHQGFER